MELAKKKKAKTEMEIKNYEDIRDIVLVTEAIKVGKGKGKNWQEFKNSLS